MSEISEQQWWYFTFGCGQKHARHYVRIFGTYAEAREQMIKQYGLEWAFQYSEDEWLEWASRCKKEDMEWLLETELKSS